jgi:predicted Zn finger-like uncharacterized protein
MALRTECPYCRKCYVLDSAMNGRKVKCRQCAQVFVASTAVMTSAQGASARPAPLPSLFDELGDLSAALPAAPAKTLAPQAAPAARGERLERAAFPWAPKPICFDEALRHPAVLWGGGLALGLIMGLLACGLVTMLRSNELERIERVRKQDPSRSFGAALYSVIIDVLPVNDLYVGFTNRDFVSGRRVGLARDKQGAMAGTGFAKALALLVLGPLAGVGALYARRRRLAKS